MELEIIEDENKSLLPGAPHIPTQSMKSLPVTQLPLTRDQEGWGQHWGGRGLLLSPLLILTKSQEASGRQDV